MCVCPLELHSQAVILLFFLGMAAIQLLSSTYRSFESESRLQLPQWLLVLLCSRGRFEEAQHLFSHENGQLCLGWTWQPGWWYQPTPLKNDGVKVSLDDDIPNIWKNTCSKPATSNMMMAIPFGQRLSSRVGFNMFQSRNQRKPIGADHHFVWILWGNYTFLDIPLVGGAITILKNMSSSMGRMTSHILWKKMFETTNQSISQCFGSTCWWNLMILEDEPAAPSISKNS